MLHLHFQAFTTWLHANPQWGGLAAFVVAFAESIAIVGTIIPGSITMTAIGILVGSGVIPMDSTVSLAILGAVIGDSISYTAGYFLKDRIKNMWPFSKHPEWLDHAKGFFDKHGGKSIFLGRFIGPIRAMIPIIAGMLHLKPIRFFPFDIAAAIIWAPAYLLPGYLVGRAALALPADIATQLILIVLAILVLIWIVAWLIKHTSAYISRLVDKLANNLWFHMLASKRWYWVCAALKDARNLKYHGQLVIAIGCVTCALLFLLLWLDVAFHGPVSQLNYFFYHAFRSFRVYPLDIVMSVVTTIGQKIVVLPLFIAVFAWLCITRCWRAAWHWFLVCLFSTGTAYFIKSIYFSPRPAGIVFIKHTSSFPSGHATIAMAFYGFLAWLICLNKPNWRKIVFSIAAIMILLVMASRIYLGYHWFTDVLGSALLGMACITATVISYRRKLVKPPAALPLAIVTLLVLIASSSFYLHKNFRQQLRDTQPLWKIQVLSVNDWWNYRTPIIPVYRTTRFGKPAELLNLQWGGNLNLIQKTLAADGWVDLKSVAGQHLVKKLEEEKKIKRLALLPPLFEDQKPVITVLKEFDPNEPAAVIRLWQSNIMLSPDSIPLWLGTLDFQRPNKSLLFHKAFRLVPMNTALRILKTTLSHEDWKVVKRPRNMIPAALLPSPDAPHYTIIAKPEASTIKSDY